MGGGAYPGDTLEIPGGRRKAGSIPAGKDAGDRRRAVIQRRKDPRRGKADRRQRAYF